MGILLGIGNIESVSFDETEKALNVQYTDGHTETVPLTGLTSDVSEQIEALKAADTEIKSTISTETTRAKAAETANTTLTNEETTRAKAAEAALNTALANKVEASAIEEETERAEAAESQLNTLVTEETARAKEKEGSLTDSVEANATAISEEETRAKAAEAEFIGKVEAETSRAEAEETRLANLIDDEEERAKATEEELNTALSAKADSSEIEAEATRAKEAEESITNSLSGYEKKSYKTQYITSSSTETQYPSAKACFDKFANYVSLSGTEKITGVKTFLGVAIYFKYNSSANNESYIKAPFNGALGLFSDTVYFYNKSNSVLGMISKSSSDSVWIMKGSSYIPTAGAVYSHKCAVYSDSALRRNRRNIIKSDEDKTGETEFEMIGEWIEITALGCTYTLTAKYAISSSEYFSKEVTINSGETVRVTFSGVSNTGVCYFWAETISTDFRAL